MNFPDLAWDASLFGMTVLAEFVQQIIGGTTWAAIVVPAPDLAMAAVSAELDQLQMLAEYRPEVMSEALAQMTDMVGYWAGLLMFSPYSHPWTFRLARTAIVVGEFLAMHYKRQFQRARPSQLSPGLMPPIAVPGHASYPSGHATQAYLLSQLLAQVMPNVVTNAYGPTATATPGTPADFLLDRLAQRVARNREVLGVHYPSDSAAGQGLAAAAFPLLQQCPSLAGAAGALALASNEW